VEAVTALKNEPGDANIGMSGSVSVVRQLLAAGLLDELHLLVHPIAVRKGMRLFDEGDSPIPLKLIKSETFETGVLNLVYAPTEPTDATYEDAKAHLSRANE
jgi:dihydrofolate reductase